MSAIASILLGGQARRASAAAWSVWPAHCPSCTTRRPCGHESANWRTTPGMPPRPTGLTSADAQDDFLRARRRRALARLRARAVRDPGDLDLILPFDEVVEALGRVGERDLGVQVIAGGLDRRDRRPRHGLRPLLPARRPGACARAGSGSRRRCAAASRCRRSTSTGSATPTSSATATTACRSRARCGIEQIEAHVVEVVTRVGATRELTVADLPRKSHERVFLERVPLPRARRRAGSSPSDPLGLRAAGRGRRGVGVPRRSRSAASCWTASRPRASGSRASTCRSSNRCARRDRSASGTEADAYLRVGAERYDRPSSRASRRRLPSRRRATAASALRRRRRPIARRLRPERASNRWIDSGCSASCMRSPGVAFVAGSSRATAMPSPARRHVGGAAVGGQLGELLALGRRPRRSPKCA